MRAMAPTTRTFSAPDGTAADRLVRGSVTVNVPLHLPDPR